MVEKIEFIRKSLYKSKPLIHCITNSITMNQCANVILSVGARPIMAEHPSEVCEITETAKSLLLNLGNISDIKMQSMRLSAETARENRIPSVLDLVGISCSRLRREFASELIERNRFAVIKGNYSEIQSLSDSAYRSSGVDSAHDINARELSGICRELSEKHGAVILASGETDIIACGSRCILVKNGTQKMSEITGTGCMLGALCASYLAVANGVDAALCACAVLEISAELADKSGNASFITAFADNISLISKKDIEKHIKTEEKIYD